MRKVPLLFSDTLNCYYNRRDHRQERISGSSKNRSASQSTLNILYFKEHSSHFQTQVYLLRSIYLDKLCILSCITYYESFYLPQQQ